MITRQSGLRRQHFLKFLININRRQWIGRKPKKSNRPLVLLVFTAGGIKAGENICILLPAVLTCLISADPNTNTA